MSIVDAVKAVISAPDLTVIPPKVDLRLLRGRARMRKGANMRRLCMRFWRDEQFWWLNDKGNLVENSPYLSSRPGSGKPPHRVRTSRNYIKRLVEEKVSASTQRVPSFQVNPSTLDQTRKAAAELASKVALYGYDKWRWRRATVKVVELALVADEGFAWPIFDTNIGPFVMDPETDKFVGMGEVRILTFSRNQVFWEPGVEFDESPWVAVERAMPVDDAKNIDGYLGGDLAADGDVGDTAIDKRGEGSKSQLVLVTDYLERPCPDYPDGRWLTMANKRVICDVKPYPLTDPQGRALDEPVLHRLSYCVDPDSDQDTGLVRHLIDPQRSLNDIVSKMLEWKNRVLNPQILVRQGTLFTKPNDVPGAEIEWQGNDPPQWQVTPPIPATLFQLYQQTITDMQAIAGSTTPMQGEPGVQAVESDPDSWQSFVADLAEWHSRMMRHCLFLVQKHYSEERDIGFRGEFGWEPISAFKGADLLGQADVRVLPDSLTKVTKEQVQNELQFLAQAAPGQLTLEQMLSALAEGSTQTLLNAYQYDIGMAEDVIKKLKAGPEAFFAQPQRMDPVPVPQPDGTVQIQMQPVEGWFPRKVDNAQVQMTVLAKYMKTPDFFSQDQSTQEAFYIYYEQLEQLKTQAIAQVAQAQTQMAQSYGQQNAAAPQTPPAAPSLPSMQPSLGAS